MQTAYEIAEARYREADMKVKRYMAKPPRAYDQRRGHSAGIMRS
jgi:hypothetical protein